jgi:hypothetical protein
MVYIHKMVHHYKVQSVARVPLTGPQTGDSVEYRPGIDPLAVVLTTSDTPLVVQVVDQ